MNTGSSNRLTYDYCAYRRRLKESTDPFRYRMDMNPHENCNKCVYDKFYKPNDPEIIDIESELKNINRPATKCPEFKYNPTCKPSKCCVSTFDDSVPVVLAPELCPIIFNNIPRVYDTGDDGFGTGMPNCDSSTMFQLKGKADPYKHH